MRSGKSGGSKLDDAALLQRELCGPLGMVDTGSEVHPQQRSRWAQGYAADGAPVAHLRPLPLFVGASDAHSTLADLLLFLRWNMGLTAWGRPLLPVLQEKRLATTRPGVDMALDEVRELLRFKDAPGKDCANVNALLDEHIGHVSQRIRELRALERELRVLRARCESPGHGKDCGILGGLGTSSGRTSKTTTQRHVRGTH